jgi:hypothetical protein
VLRVAYVGFIPGTIVLTSCTPHRLSFALSRNVTMASALRAVSHNALFRSSS